MAALTGTRHLDDPTGLHAVPLVDHHCHGVARGPLDRASFERYLTEAADPAPAGTTFFDTQLGVAVRRWCGPALGVAPHAPPDEYLRRRAELGPDDVTRRLMRAAGIGHLLVDTGYGSGPEMLTPAELAAAGEAAAHRVVRLETVAEQVLASGTSAHAFAAGFAAALDAATADAVALKSVLAYRHGLAIDPDPPAPEEVRSAAGRWLFESEDLDSVRLAGRAAREAPARPRLTDDVLLRHVLWTGVARGLPIQLHTGFGDPDLDLGRSDPALLTPFLRAVQPRGVDVVLLHCYPFHRQAGYLAQVFPHVYCDLGLTLNHVGARAAAVIAESLELAPFHKLLFSTDAFGLPELYCAGAALFRDGIASALQAWVMEGSWARSDARRVAQMVGAGNAARLYRLGRDRSG